MRLNLALTLVAAIAMGCGSNVVGDTAGNGSGSTATNDGSSGGSSGTSGDVGPRPTYPNVPDGPVAVGAVLPNVTVQGYLSATSGTRIDQATSWSTFDMQKIRNLVDANGKPYRYMLLDLSAGWCQPCNIEAEEYGLSGTNSAKIGEWLSKGGLFVTVLVQNHSETSPALPDQSDISKWISDNQPQASLAGDFSGDISSRLGQTAFPANLIINLDTMKIEDGWYGTADNSADLSEFEADLNNQ